MPHSRLFIIVLTIVVVAGVTAFLARTRYGRRMRAVTQHRELAAVSGLGKVRGAVIAAVVLGLLSSFSERSTSASIGKAIVFVAVIVFLQFRPNGIVSFRTRGLVA